MPDITIYTQNDCPPCTFVKNYLTHHEVPYTEKNIAKSEYRNEMIDYDAFATPFILLDGEPMYQVDMDKINQVCHIETSES
ncbi:glutaredoxin [Staphylococcus auricularis]|nr:glutaredoxin domain-containing protein [Staphylococcus auricularis]MBM0867573.1 glutaredoxin family protein [Staphylococcus auricularis]MCG7340439.1 glutaredoxin family protein [Staphylococcus auricularis]MDC6326393.1 glutaredoxin domain-containing protein [Staphylococcus auricularis]MDN4532270.1 glutaredoxin domain-containing protein [Staphylococcus auricularis]PNZ65821.1 NrdH-redoxin [Staphylococcus auricularis]